MDHASNFLVETAHATNALAAHKKILFLNSYPGANLPDQNVTCYQPLKSIAPPSGAIPLNNLEDIDSSYETVLILGTKNVRETQYYLARGLDALSVGGHLLIAAENKENGKRFEKWFQSIGLSAQIYAGRKSRCAIVERPQKIPESFQAWIADGKPQNNPEGFYSQSGLFSWDHIDPASHLLIESINDPIKGDIADFGCGYGYLSATIRENNPDIRSLTGIDADSRALTCFEKNLIPYEETTATHWIDLEKEYRASPPFDFILMNPPFHTGRKHHPSLGIAFIENAARNLKRNGVLWMVANTHLPYERTLEDCFYAYEQIRQDKGFKIIRAVK